MKRTLLCFLSLLAITASAQQTPVNADVYTVKEGNASILSGSTRFLETLEINSITLATNSTAKGHQRHDDLEELVIVKSGTLTVAQNNNAQTLGPGSVALTMPGDKHTLINTSKAPVTFYVLTYRSNEKFNTPRGQKSGGSFMLDRETITLHYIPATRQRRHPAVLRSPHIDVHTNGNARHHP